MSMEQTARPNRILATLLAGTVLGALFVLLNPHPAHAVTVGKDQYHCPNYGEMYNAYGVWPVTVENYYWRRVALLYGYHAITGDYKYYSFLTDEAGDPNLPASGDLVSLDWKFRITDHDSTRRTCGYWQVQVSGTDIQTWGILHENQAVYGVSPVRSCFNVGGNWVCTDWDGMFAR